MELSGPPPCYEVEYQTLLTSEALMFVAELVRQFDKNVEQVIYIMIIIGCYLYSSFVLCFVSPRQCFMYQFVHLTIICMNNFASKTVRIHCVRNNKY